MTLAELIGQAEGLVALRPASVRLAQLLSTSTYVLEDVEKVIQYDPLLSASVLRMANSVMMASTRRILSVKDAVIRIGSGRILRMVMGLSVKESFGAAVAVYGFAEDDLWKHSIIAAAAAECLGKYTEISINTISFTAALVHDIGKVVLARAFKGDDLSKVLCCMKDSHISWSEAEKVVFGFSHCEVGAALATGWNLPEEIVNAIANHNRTDIDFSVVTDAVRISNMVARVSGEGMGHEGMGFTIDREVANRLGLTREGLECLCADARIHAEIILKEFAT